MGQQASVFGAVLEFAAGGYSNRVANYAVTRFCWGLVEDGVPRDEFQINCRKTAFCLKSVVISPKLSYMYLHTYL